MMVSIVVVDQATKWWAASMGKTILNTGGTFGLFPSPMWPWVLTAFWLWLVWHWVQLKNTVHKCALAAVLAAGFSNLLDRFRLDGVQDMIYYPWFNIYGNVADIVITLAVIALLYASLQDRGGE